MSQKQAQEQVTKDPKGNDPFRTKYKATALGGEEKKKKDEKLGFSKVDYVKSLAVDEAIDKWTRRAKLKHG